MKEEEKHSPKQFLEDPLADRGNGIQALAKRHARLLLHTNIWQRSSSWLSPLEEREVLSWYALHMYCRLVRRYQLSSPIPDEAQPIDPIWLADRPAASETECQFVARMLYIASFGHELFFGGYLSNYRSVHAGRWNHRIHREHEQARRARVPLQD